MSFRVFSPRAEAPVGQPVLLPDWEPLVAFAQVGEWIYDGEAWSRFDFTSVQKPGATPFGVSVQTTGESTPAGIPVQKSVLDSEYSVLAHVRLVSFSTFDTALWFGDTGGTAGFQLASAGSAPFKFSSVGRTGHAGFTMDASNGTGASVATYSLSGLTANLYRDGALIETAAHAVVSGATVVAAGIGGRSGASNRNWRGHNNLAVLFTKALDAAVARDLSAHPWQIFKGAPSRVFINAAAGGDTTIAATAAALSFAGANVSIDESINAAAGSVAFAGVQAAFAEVVSSVPGEVVFSGATTSIDESVDATAAAVLFSGVQASVEVAGAVEINCTAAAITFTAPQAALVETVFTNTNALAFQGGTAGFTVTLEASAGEVTFEGVQGAVFAPVIVDCTAAVLSFGGGTATIVAGGGPRGRARGRRRHYGTLEPAADQPMANFVPPEPLPAAERFVSMAELLRELTPVVPASAPADQKTAKRARNLNALAEILKLI